MPSIDRVQPMFRYLTIAAAGALALLSTATAHDKILVVDRAQTYELDEPISSIVVGNPAIADVSVHTRSEVLLFGKMPGSTNVYFFGESGTIVKNLRISVVNPRANVVTLQLGADRYSFHCAPVCEQTLTIGDGSNTSRTQTNDVASQADRKFGLASAAAENGSVSSQFGKPITEQTPEESAESEESAVANLAAGPGIGALDLPD